MLFLYVMQLRVSKKELDELRTVNGSLGNRLEALGSLTNFGHRSLLNEIESEASTLTPADELQHVSNICVAYMNNKNTSHVQMIRYKILWKSSRNNLRNELRKSFIVTLFGLCLSSLTKISSITFLNTFSLVSISKILPLVLLLHGQCQFLEL